MDCLASQRARRPRSIFTLILLAAAGCAAPEKRPAAIVADDPLSLAARFLGGAGALRTVRAVEVTATGQRLEPGQAHAPGHEDFDMPVSTFRYAATDDHVRDRAAMVWHRDVTYPYPTVLDYKVIVDAEHGFIEGKDGVFSPPRAPMLAANIATLRKLRLLTSPDLLIDRALTHSEQLGKFTAETYNGAAHHAITLNVEESIRPLRMFVNAETGMPSKIETVEDDPMFGDALVEVELSDWRAVSGIQYPFSLTYKVAGRVVQSESRTRIEVSQSDAPDSIFQQLVDVAKPSDSAGFALGARSSQWFLRMHAYGIPHYNREMPVVITDVAPGVVHLAGGTHHSLAVELDDQLVVIEAPLYEERTQAVLAALAVRWPNKQVRTVVATHFHDDHAGGLRAYAAAGATLVVSETSKNAVAAYLGAPHTVHADTLAKQPRSIKLVGVKDKLVLGAGKRTIELHAVKSSHASDMLAAFLPTERFLLVSDIYSPGAVPEPFKIFARELLAFIDSSHLVVERLGGTHGGIGSLQELRAAVAK